MAITSTEFYVNMKKGDIPPWNDLLSFEEQPLETQQFWENEAEKVLKGVTINGFHIHGMLYWYLNHWQIPVDVRQDDGQILREIRRPDLRDNELFFMENFEEAERRRLNLFLFGTRRFGKALMDSEIIYTKAGPKPIGLAMYGDYIYDDTGTLVKIKGVYPQGYVDSYRVKFEDGRSVVCCPDHLWKTKIGDKGPWVTRSVRNLLGKKNVRIPLCGDIDHPEREDLPLNPVFYGSLVAAYLIHGSDNPLLSKTINEKYVLSSKIQRKSFIDEFINTAIGVFTGYDEIDIKKMDHHAIRFVKEIFWASGMYCATYENKIVISNIIKDVKIVSIKPGPRVKCTCIEVDNQSGLFLTSDHLVTHNTALIANYTGYHALTRPNGYNSIVCGNADDVSQISSYLEIGLDGAHPFFKFSRIGNDFTKEVILGARFKDNTRIPYSTIRVTNVDMGKKFSTQKTAGATPSSAVFDEVGKFSFLASYLAAIPSYMSEYGMRLVAILSGTSGEIDMCSDAQKVLENPENYYVLPANWDILGREAGKFATWKPQSWSMFPPGQMSLSFPKKQTTLAKHLGREDARGLAKIKVKVTDWEKSTETIKDKLKELKKSDRINWANYKMYYPLDPDDCFFNAHVNKYPVEMAIARRRELDEKGQVGILADVWLKDDKTLGWKYSDKMLAGFPFEGGLWDAPVQIFEFPETIYDFSDHVYAAGLDIYKRDTSTNTSSLGAFYIFKRMVKLGDPYANRIVCSYVSRPADIDYYCETCRTLLWAYGARCLFENADVAFETYLKRKNEAELLLVRGDDIACNLVKPGNYTPNGNFGLSTAAYNQTFLENIGVRYTSMEIAAGEDGDTKKAVQLIDDVGLLTEYIEYKPGKNVDRMVGFHHALALADYYDYMKYFPKTPIQKEEEKRRSEALKKRMSNRSFTNVSRPFR